MQIAVIRGTNKVDFERNLIKEIKHGYEPIYETFRITETIDADNDIITTFYILLKIQQHDE